jgi:hypothetical protein
VGDRHVRIYLDRADSFGRAYVDFPVDSITVKVIPPPAKVGDVITTVEGLKALPVGTVGRTGSGMVAEKGRRASGTWSVFRPDQARTPERALHRHRPAQGGRE